MSFRGLFRAFLLVLIHIIYSVSELFSVFEKKFLILGGISSSYQSEHRKRLYDP